MVYSDSIEKKIDLLSGELKEKYPEVRNRRWHAIKLLEQDQEITAQFPISRPDIIDRSYETDIINEKYDFIEEMINEVLFHKEAKEAATDRVDGF